MKKLLLSLSIFLLSLILIYPLNATEDEYIEKYYSLEFDNLNSKNINEVFNGLKYNIIEVEVQTTRLTKSYRFNLSLVNNLEQELNNLILNDLKEILPREEISIIETKGFKITRIDLRCTKYDKEILLERVN